MNFTSKENTEHLVTAKLPTKYGTFHVKAYPSAVKDFPHLVLYTEKIEAMQVIDVRIHSECMTGDVFGSTKCDCGDQLDYSMKWIQQNGGMILYLRQEGRGIGLVNKLKAYNLQAIGFDTKEANLELGFHEDARDYTLAISILKSMKINKIRLLTNNPEKISAFDRSEIEIIERIPIEITPNMDNLDYLRTKKNKMGHMLSLKNI
ncbi:MAG: GTP cyclohydrolase II [Flammeovirgaceae bacterium]|nr:GTP cyclohydrolase II [Flammeovirgaceae bacterium]